MSAAQNLSYAAIQVLHNFGAVAVVSGSLSALLLHEKMIRKKLAYLTLTGWMLQGASGATFGMVSYYYHGQFPDISGVATVALGIKIICVTAGFLLLVVYLWRGECWSEQQVNGAWLSSSVMAVTAISAAAFLRWFS